MTSTRIRLTVWKACAAVAFLLIAAIDYLLPKKRQLLLHSFPDVEDQCVAVLRRLARGHEARGSVVVLVRGSPEDVRNRLLRLVGDYANDIRIIRKFHVRAIWEFCRSETVLFTHGLYGFLPRPRRQLIINMWHGMPIKAIWKAAATSPVPPCRYLLSTSASFSKVLSAVSGLAADRILPIGLPRNDLLFSKSAPCQAFRRSVTKDVKHFVMFLPTYRLSKQGSSLQAERGAESALLMSERELSALQQLLAETQTRMLVKPHPMSPHYGSSFVVDKYLSVVSDSWLHAHGVTLYEALGQADVLISDISSVVIDFLSTRRPCIIFFPDFSIYRNSRRFLLEPLPNYLPGRLCTDAAGLLTELRAVLSGNDEFEMRRAELGDLLNPQVEASATTRLLQLIGSRE